MELEGQKKAFIWANDGLEIAVGRKESAMNVLKKNHEL